MKHYGASKEDIIRFFSSLRTGKLAEVGYYKVYNVDKLYVIRSKLQKLKAGTSVFYTPGGEVAMLLSCGNATDIKIVTPRYLLENTVTPIDVLTPPPYVPFVPGLPEDVCIPEAIYPPTITEETEREVIIEKKRRSWFPIPIPIPLIRTRTKDCPPCDVIPGPAAAISFGMMALASRRRRKK